MQIISDFIDANYSKGTNTREYIIVHHTGTNANAQANHRYILSSEVSWHYTVDRNGDVYQILNEDRIAWHCGESSWQGRVGMNKYSIGIEVCSNGSSFTDHQKKVVPELIRDIMGRNGIPIENVLRHADIAPNRKWDISHIFYKPDTWADWKLKNLMANKYRVLHEQLVPENERLFSDYSKDEFIAESDVKMLIDIAVQAMQKNGKVSEDILRSGVKNIKSKK